MIRYIHQLADWPQFTWNKEFIATLLADIRYRQGMLMGRMQGLGLELKTRADYQSLTIEVLKSSEIEGEMLNVQEVRSSLARRLGLNEPGLVKSSRHVDGIVDIMLEATKQHAVPLTKEKLFQWHASLFPTGRSGIRPIVAGAWRNNPTTDPMQVVSGTMGNETVHFEAPESDRLEAEMACFLEWYNQGSGQDFVLKSGIAHLWFVTVHPFDDGNGRIARVIGEKLLTQADNSNQLFYSLSAQIMKERKTYYDVLERTQRGDLGITEWLHWYLKCLGRSFDATEETLSLVLQKAEFWKLHGNLVLNARQIKVLNKLLDGFEGNLTSSKWAKISKCSHDTALRDIQDLVGKQILAKADDGGRGTHYVLST
jgi:Fic family protein